MRNRLQKAATKDTKNFSMGSSASVLSEGAHLFVETSFGRLEVRFRQLVVSVLWTAP